MTGCLCRAKNTEMNCLCMDCSVLMSAAVMNCFCHVQCAYIKNCRSMMNDRGCILTKVRLRNCVRLVKLKSMFDHNRIKSIFYIMLILSKQA